MEIYFLKSLHLEAIQICATQTLRLYILLQLYKSTMHGV